MRDWLYRHMGGVVACGAACLLVAGAALTINGLWMCGFVTMVPATAAVVGIGMLADELAADLDGKP